MFVSFISPLLFLGAMGFGLGSLISRGPVGTVDGVTYVAFLGPGLLAATTMQTAYVEATYAHRPPARDPLPTWLAVRQIVVRGLFGRRLGGWFGEDASVALPPRGHPELLKQWGARRRRD